MLTSKHDCILQTALLRYCFGIWLILPRGFCHKWFCCSTNLVLIGIKRGHSNFTNNTSTNTAKLK